MNGQWLKAWFLPRFLCTFLAVFLAASCAAVLHIGLGIAYSEYSKGRARDEIRQSVQELRKNGGRPR